MGQLTSRIRNLERIAARPCPTCADEPEEGDPKIYPWEGRPAERDEYSRIMEAIFERARAAGMPSSIVCPDCGRVRPNYGDGGIFSLATVDELHRLLALAGPTAGESDDTAPARQPVGTGDSTRPGGLSELPPAAGPR